MPAKDISLPSTKSIMQRHSEGAEKRLKQTDYLKSRTAAAVEKEDKKECPCKMGKRVLVKGDPSFYAVVTNVFGKEITVQDTKGNLHMVTEKEIESAGEVPSPRVLFKRGANTVVHDPDTDKIIVKGQSTGHIVTAPGELLYPYEDGQDESKLSVLERDSRMKKKVPLHQDEGLTQQQEASRSRKIFDIHPHGIGEMPPHREDRGHTLPRPSRTDRR
jgi:hypothetical protein